MQKVKCVRIIYKDVKVNAFVLVVTVVLWINIICYTSLSLMAEHRFFLEEQFYLGKCYYFATTTKPLLLCKQQWNYVLRKMLHRKHQANQRKTFIVKFQFKRKSSIQKNIFALVFCNFHLNVYLFNFFSVS